MNEPIMFRPPVLTRKLERNVPGVRRRAFRAPGTEAYITRDLTMPVVDVTLLDVPTYQRKPVSQEKLEQLHKASTLPSLLLRQAQ